MRKPLYSTLLVSEWRVTKFFWFIFIGEYIMWTCFLDWTILQFWRPLVAVESCRRIRISVSTDSSLTKMLAVLVGVFTETSIMAFHAFCNENSCVTCTTLFRIFVGGHKVVGKYLCLRQPVACSTKIFVWMM